jgi:hypothetical protein
LRLFAIKTVYDAFAQAADLPTGPSRAIEDLADLGRLRDERSDWLLRFHRAETPEAKRAVLARMEALRASVSPAPARP